MVVQHPLPRRVLSFFLIPLLPFKSQIYSLMKLHSLLFLIILSFVFTTANADIVPREKAERVAKNFMFEKLNSYGSVTDINDISIIDSYTKLDDGIPVFYAFTLNKGWIIVSAEDVFTPVIGYSFDGQLKLEDAPAHYRGFINNYAEQINYIRENSISAEADVVSDWQRLTTGDISILNVNRGSRSVEPLLSNMWNQDHPYNVMCPEDEQGPGGHVYVGCVATAMSMIMYYWRYPETGTGQHCYTPGHISYGQQCANYGNTEYQWEGMNNSIDSKNPFPNAELQYHAAVSVNMNFSPNGSGSQSFLVPGALSSYFRYNSAQYVEKNNYPTTTWYNMLKDELDIGRPLYYSGYNSTDGGHAFVCDGYQGNDFHFNFGWSGYSNGFYSLSSVGGFNLGQAAVRYFYPTETDYPYHASGDIMLTQKSGSFTDGSGPINSYLNNNTATFIIDPQTEEDSITDITLEFIEFDVHSSDYVRVYDGGDNSYPLIGEFTGTAVPAEIVSTGNKLCIEFNTDGSGNSDGWYAEYSTSSPLWCSGLTEFTEAADSFEDGSGTFNYNNGSTCLYRIEPEGASSITLYFNSFETEEDMDRVKVFDGSVEIAEFSGSDLPEPVTATSGSMFITFTTNQNTTMGGWEAYYESDLVGIEETEAVSELSVYPVPATNRINLNLTFEEQEEYRLDIISMTGELVYSEEKKVNSGTYSNVLDITNYAPGVYFVKIQTSKGFSGSKFIVE